MIFKQMILLNITQNCCITHAISVQYHTIPISVIKISVSVFSLNEFVFQTGSVLISTSFSIFHD